MAKTAAEIVASATARDKHNRRIISPEDGKVLIEAGASSWRERGTEAHNPTEGTTTLTRVIIFQGETLVYHVVVPLET
jgi:hypothetical protein